LDQNDWFPPARVSSGYNAFFSNWFVRKWVQQVFKKSNLLFYNDMISDFKSIFFLDTFGGQSFVV